jgi:hypothetical protein
MQIGSFHKNAIEIAKIFCINLQQFATLKLGIIIFIIRN